MHLRIWPASCLRLSALLVGEVIVFVRPRSLPPLLCRWKTPGRSMCPAFSCYDCVSLDYLDQLVTLEICYRKEPLKSSEHTTTKSAVFCVDQWVSSFAVNKIIEDPDPCLDQLSSSCCSLCHGIRISTHKLAAVKRHPDKTWYFNWSSLNYFETTVLPHCRYFSRTIDGLLTPSQKMQSTNCQNSRWLNQDTAKHVSTWQDQSLFPKVVPSLVTQTPKQKELLDTILITFNIAIVPHVSWGVEAYPMIPLPAQ